VVGGGIRIEGHRPSPGGESCDYAILALGMPVGIGVLVAAGVALIEFGGAH
jgi:hypothetical protein